MAKKAAVLVVDPVNGAGLFHYLEAFFENGIPRLSVGGAAAHDCLSEQDRSPLRNAGRIGPATSETMDYPL